MSLTTVWNVSGMTCGGCAKTIERVLRKKLPQITDISVDHKNGTVRIVSSDELAGQQVQDAVTAAGFQFVGARE